MRCGNSVWTAFLTVLVTCLMLLPQQAKAHFSYSDPRVLHITETETDGLVILIRMPAALALLPGDWQGPVETRLPPFATLVGDEFFIDRDVVRANEAAFLDLLLDGLTVRIGQTVQALSVDQTRFWLDTDRPTFGTAKSAQKALAREEGQAALPYFDTTLDVAFHVPTASLTDPLLITSELGKNFQIMDKFGTVVKLHRASGTETAAMIGMLQADFPIVQSPLDRLTDIALIGAEHIYLGFDHLALIVLIAIAAVNWRQALLWASAFTIGHVLTLVAGLYGYAPQAAWFIPMVELLIVGSIVAAAASIALKLPHVMSWPVLFGIGLIHGYGFASAADVALFAGNVDAPTLAAFAIGLELCQFAIYLSILPMIVLLDRTDVLKGLRWRRSVAFVLAALAGVSVFQQLVQATGFTVA